jgi:toxin ParE1/3/4
VKRKTVVFRTAANRDVREAANYYTDMIDADTAFRFALAVSAGIHDIAVSPKLGSPRYAELVNLPGLRNRKLRRFPQIVFYMEYDEHIEIIRVLHAARDIPAWLSEPEGDD